MIIIKAWVSNLLHFFYYLLHRSFYKLEASGILQPIPGTQAYTIFSPVVPAFYSGIISLEEMVPGDEVEITYSILMGSKWLLFSREIFKGNQLLPALVIPAQEFPSGIMITLRQSHGLSKAFSFLFYKMMGRISS